MITEIATLTVRAGQESAFEDAFATAQRYLTARDGYLWHDLQRSLEQPNQYVLLVGWESVEAHTDGFRGSEEYANWKALLHHFYDPFPEVGHYSHVAGSARS